jgi:glycosyltransferase involved in cell wall biosynthesis
MKILMVISQFHPLIGGVEKQAKLLAKKLVEKGVSVTIITGWWKFDPPRKEMIDGIKIFRNFCGWGMFGMNKHRTIRAIGGIIYVITLGSYLLLHGREYDIIHVHQFLYPAFVSVLIGKKLLKKPVLIISTSSGKTSDVEMLKRLPAGCFQLKYLLKETDYLVTISKATSEDFKQIGYSESRILYIPNGVEIPSVGKISYNQGLNVQTTVRLIKEKGVDILLRAWANVLEQEKALKLAIMGNGPLELELKGLVQSLGLVGSVDFIGMTHHVAQHLRDADLFILPSRSEGLSVALLEAMSYGIPCIATRVGGNSELLGGGDKEIPLESYGIAENGLLVNPEDVKGLSKAILYFIRNERAREEMGRRARKFIQENYSIDWVAERYLDLYQSILNKR